MRSAGRHSVCEYSPHVAQNILTLYKASAGHFRSACVSVRRLYENTADPKFAHRARKDTVLPLSTPVIGQDGAQMHELVIPRGTNFVVSILAANRDPKIWGSDAHIWNPARWAALPQSVQDAHMPGTYSKMYAHQHLPYLIPSL